MSYYCDQYRDKKPDKLRRWKPFLLAAVLMLFAIGCDRMKVERGQNGRVDPASKVVNASDSIIIPLSELAEKVKRFENGEINLAFPLYVTYHDLGDEVSASIYSRSLSLQENNPDAVAVQFETLKNLERTSAVCEAMKLNLEVWHRWRTDQVYNYAAAKLAYDERCS
jgi:hypothetical protein